MLLSYLKKHGIMLLLLSSIFAPQSLEAKGKKQDNAETRREAERLTRESTGGVRRFHEVLDELLAEFAYDIKKGDMRNIKNLSIRKVDVSKAIPKTYKKYLRLLSSERIKENSNINMIVCLPCQRKSSKLVEGKLMVTSAATNLAMLRSAADQMGIDNFMDIVLVYHTTHMVLAFEVFDVQTGKMVWTRTYNSETSRSRYQKLAIDYKQVEKSRDSDEYVPEYRLLIGLGGAGIPNIGGTTSDSTMINLQFRGTEKFDNRRTEFGILLSLYKTLNSIVKPYPTIGTSDEEEKAVEDEPLQPKPFTTAFGLYGLYAKNFIGAVESYDDTRLGMNTGLGIFLTSGYLAPIARLGLDAYFGRRFATNFSVLYIFPSEIVIAEEAVNTKGGIGADLVISFNY